MILPISSSVMRLIHSDRYAVLETIGSRAGLASTAMGRFEGEILHLCLQKLSLETKILQNVHIFNTSFFIFESFVGLRARRSFAVRPSANFLLLFMRNMPLFLNSLNSLVCAFEESFNISTTFGKCFLIWCRRKLVNMVIFGQKQQGLAGFFVDILVGVLGGDFCNWILPEKS